uniref:Uncharacterized protein n=1 Tax=Rhizobium meliloti TaxID=382 RepID=A0A0D4DCN3_RHIML|nr:hypothetical protein [Sinorhizobium meliloti]
MPSCKIKIRVGQAVIRTDRLPRWRRLIGSQDLKGGTVGFSGVNRQCDFTPGGDGLGAELAMIVGGEMFPMEMKEVGDLAVNRDETLTWRCHVVCGLTIVDNGLG